MRFTGAEPAGLKAQIGATERSDERSPVALAVGAAALALVHQQQHHAALAGQHAPV